MENILDFMKMRVAATLENMNAALFDFGENEVAQDQEEQPGNEI